MKSPPRQGSCSNAPGTESVDRSGRAGSSSSEATRKKSRKTRVPSSVSSVTSAVSFRPRGTETRYPMAPGSSGAMYPRSWNGSDTTMGATRASSAASRQAAPRAVLSSPA